MEQADEAKPRILVVDDSRVIRIAARKILKDEFETLEAGDGEEAWETLAKEHNIALVITDLSMPYLDGMGLLKRIRGADDAQLQSLPVIIVTGAEDDDEAKSNAFAAGATDFITKPFDSVQLLAHTRSHMRLQKTTQELKETAATLKEKPATDPFTGLANQHAFLEGGHQGLAYAIRHSTSMALIMFQVDKFDHIFVHQGKAIAGAILKLVTAAIKAEIRREDVAARISMARFGLILPSSSTEGAERLAARVCTRVANSQIKCKDGNLLPITLSAGVVAPPITRDVRFEGLLGQALKNLEQALAQGDSVVVEPVTPAEAAESAVTEAAQTASAPPAGPTSDAAPAAAVAATPPGEAATPATDSGAREVLSARTPEPTLEQALEQLACNQGYALHPHLDRLVTRLLPLLEHWNLAGQLGIDDAITRIRAALERG